MPKELMYKKFAKYYDKIQAQKKDYSREVDFIEWAIKKHKKSEGNKLLDVACGTANHAVLLEKNYKILGIDISKEMLEIAKRKTKNVKFEIWDMKKLNLPERFDVIICMFSAINYNTSYSELETTLRNFYNHLKPGGVLIYDLGFNKETWIEGYTQIVTVVEDGLQLARISQSHLDGDVFNANFIFLVKDKGKFDFDIDQHKIGVFETLKVKKIMQKIGFKTIIYSDFTKRLWSKKLKKKPVFVGIKP
ncbi:MAG: class I SAM-dependent methyltransferase [Candidatus Diapherotrites archaeon]|nr:class I SAM-dependent methyltransferase [Candidatus Diapherotrites archaeon]